MRTRVKERGRTCRSERNQGTWTRRRQRIQLWVAAQWRWRMGLVSARLVRGEASPVVWEQVGEGGRECRGEE
jgi:hypothetical protein